MDIDFRKIENEARYKAQNLNVNKDKFASNAIVRALLKEVPEASNLLKNVNDKIIKNGKNLMIKIKYCSTNYVAQTMEGVNNIYIDLHFEKIRGRIKDVFVHELGEADYIARNLPDIVDLKKRDCLKSRILELFTHKHIFDLLKSYNLKEKDVIKDYEEYITKKDFVKPEEWNTVLGICWELISFPVFEGKKQSINGYRENITYIEKILDIIKNTNTLVNNNNEIRNVETSINKVLKILESLGLDNVNIKSRIN
ncbi:hypothetical protein FDF12_06615 [Clostridium botulinum]|uniref:hypothetical protein n=1 Tax=Clostridium botulinum TaxID=1491 RepID=UPI0007730390|nr:hypothetical protein [Clostridium botulinum]NFS28122.1 hypothetical protein [Clostridium botulinum]NFS54176.1 hypothetical protein [Clostridium botulinum]NFT17075.1 hypothetical protein [Clostridium botulinum]